MFVQNDVSYSRLSLCCFSLQVIGHFDGCKADLVVCDGAPDGKRLCVFVVTIFFWTTPFTAFQVITYVPKFVVFDVILQ